VTIRVCSNRFPWPNLPRRDRARRTPLRVSPPAAATALWPGLCHVIARLRDTNTARQGQIGLVRDWYQPLLERLYDYPASRAGDLDQLEQIASGYAARGVYENAKARAYLALTGQTLRWTADPSRYQNSLFSYRYIIKSPCKRREHCPAGLG
jgi:hypothetical protein